MYDSDPYSGKVPAPGARAMQASGDGFWESIATGQTEWWHLRGAAQRDAVGRPTHFAGCVRDVTAARDPK